MAHILKLIRGNLARAPATVRLPGSVPTPAGFHGRVVLDPALCLACHVCAYACVSDAITGGDEDGAYAWRYDPARCAFCARCVQLCPGRALSMAAVPAPAYLRPGQLAVCQRVELPACPDCGAPTRPVTAELLRRAFEHASAEAPELARRCERCRRRRLQRSFVPRPSTPTLSPALPLRGGGRGVEPGFPSSPSPPRERGRGSGRGGEPPAVEGEEGDR